MTKQMTKPLWQLFVEMTPEEQAAEKARDIARLEAGTMTMEEAEQRAAAWRIAAHYHFAQAKALKKELTTRMAKKLGLRLL